MKLYAGDRVLDVRGRELCLDERMKVAGRLGWQAHPVQNNRVQRDHVAVVLDSEIKGLLEGGQFLLTRKHPGGNS